MNAIIEENFRGLFGAPSWNVKQGHGSFLTFEFGKPHLEVGNVHERKYRPTYPATRRRLVAVHGEWHLWIFCCSWVIQQEGMPTAHSEDTRATIGVACEVLNGQALTSVEIDPAVGWTEFTFDLGGVLKSSGNGYGKEDVSWMLFQPNRFAFSYRADGKYSFVPSDAEVAEEWIRIDA